MSPEPEITISHAGFHVFDMDTMVNFFKTVYDLSVTDRGVMGERGEITFLGCDPRDHHQLVLYSGRTSKSGVHYNHVSFRVNQLERLRLIHSKLLSYGGITNIKTINHGLAWSVYCSDPEGNRTEAFVESPWYVAQPYEAELNLKLDDKEIYNLTKKLVEKDPSFKSMLVWRKKYKNSKS
jgi:catechol-2,3-dioxygenase